MSKILHAIFGRILAIVPGFFRIRLRFGRILGRSPKFGQKWRFVLFGNKRSLCVGTRNRLVWERGNCVIGTHEMLWLKHMRCFEWNTRDALIGTHEMLWLEHKRCRDWNTRDVVIGAQQMSWLEYTKCCHWNTRMSSPSYLFRVRAIFKDMPLNAGFWFKKKILV